MVHQFENLHLAVYNKETQQHAFITKSNTFISNPRLKFAKNQANAKQNPEADLVLFENYSSSSFTLSSKNNRIYSKNKQKSKCVCIHEIIRFIIMKIKMKMKNRSYRYDINRPGFRHGRKYSKYKKCPSMMMLVCNKQHLSNIWIWIHGKVMQHWGCAEKSVAYKEKRVLPFETPHSQ